MDVVSFFSGCGGLDLGFEQAGFQVVWANEFEPSVRSTYEHNHPNTVLCKDDINNVDLKNVPYWDRLVDTSFHRHQQSIKVLHKFQSI